MFFKIILALDVLCPKGDLPHLPLKKITALGSIEHEEKSHEKLGQGTGKRNTIHGFKNKAKAKK